MFRDQFLASGLSQVAENRELETPEAAIAKVRKGLDKIVAEGKRKRKEVDKLAALDRCAGHVDALLWAAQDRNGFAAVTIQETGDRDLALGLDGYSVSPRRRDYLTTDLLPKYAAEVKDLENAVLDKIGARIAAALKLRVDALVAENSSEGLEPTLEIINSAELAMGGAYHHNDAITAIRKMTDWGLLAPQKADLDLLALRESYLAKTTEILGNLNGVISVGIDTLQAVKPVILRINSNLDGNFVNANTKSMDAVKSRLSTIARNQLVQNWGVSNADQKDMLRTIGQSEDLFAVFQREVAATLEISDNRRTALALTDDFHAYFKQISAPEPSIKKSSTKEAYVRRNIEFLDEVCCASTQRNTTLADICTNVYSPNALRPQAMLEWSASLAPNSDFLHIIMRDRITSAMFRQRTRTMLADSLWYGQSAGYRSEGFQGFATRRSIDLIFEALRDRVAYAEFSDQWSSRNARNWAAQYRKDKLDAARTFVTDLLAQLQEKWARGSKVFNAFCADYLVKTGEPVIGKCLKTIGLGAPAMQAYLLERIPEFLNETDGLVTTWDVDPKFADIEHVDFSLHDDLGIARLSSLVSHEMILELINRTDSPIALGEALPPPDIDKRAAKNAMDCHFILRFKRGELSEELNNIGIEGPQPGWRIVGRLSRPQPVPVYDELYIRGPKDAPPIEPGHSRHLILTQMRGDKRGTRTTRVLLMHQGLVQAGKPLYPGHRQKRLRIANELPTTAHQSYQLPLHVDFVGPNKLLNDGLAQNVLNIALTSIVANNHHRQVQFQNFDDGGGSDGKANWKRSKILVSVDTNDDTFSEQKQWALCNREQANAIEFHLIGQGESDPNNFWRGSFSSQGTIAEWEFTPPVSPNSEHEMTLWRHKSLILNLSTIATSLSSGPCNIYVRCEDFPGFPDREFVLRAEKTGVGELNREQWQHPQMPEMRVSRRYIGDTSRYDIQSGNIDVAELFERVQEALCPVGTVLAYAGPTEPPGWLFCNGQVIPDGSRYQQLRAMRSDGRTPNLAYRTIVGSGDVLGQQGSVSNSDGTLPFGDSVGPRYMPLNTTGGTWWHALSLGEIPNHRHFVRLNTKYNSVLLDSVQNYYGDSSVEFEIYSGQIDAASASKAGAHPNTQPFHALHYIIKY